ncbi:hypothetical protein Tco_0072537 [Tanacetum coccineum]
MKVVFNQMEIEVDQCSVDRKYFEIEKKELLIENDRLLEQILSQDIVCIAMNSYDDLVDNYASMEKSYDAHKFLEFFEINDLKAQLQEKNTTISNLKKHVEILKGKNVFDCNEQVNNSNMIDPWMFKLDLQPLSPKLKRNMEAYVDYLKRTKKHAKTLHEIVEQARALKILDNALDYALNSSTNDSGSHPRSNTRNNRISRPSSSNMKNKQVEVHHRNVKSSLNKTNHVSVCNANVKHAVLDVNFEFVCLTCNECLFSTSHDMCVIDYLNDVNARVRDKSKSVKKKEWKHTDGVDLLKGSRGSNLYTISLEDMLKSSLICLLSKASKTKSWLWPMRVESINGKKYILVIIDDYSSEDLRKLKLKADIRIFIGYSPVKKAYRIYNKRTRMIMETIHVEFDELTVMAFE